MKNNEKAGSVSAEPAYNNLFCRKLLVNFTLRYSQLFADAFHRHLLDVRMTWHRSELSIGQVFVQTMPTPFTQKDAIVIRQKSN